MIKLSIITVNYNSGSNFLVTMDSLKDFIVNENVQYVVVDGNSNDVSWENICEHQDRIDKLVHEPDKGIYDAMNKGISLAKGDWIWFVNSGDEVSIKCKTVMEFIEKSPDKINLLYSDLRISDGRVIKQYFSTSYLLRSMINHQNLIYKKYLLSNGYDISFKYCADFAHILNRYDSVNSMKIPDFLCTYDLNGVSSSSTRNTRVAIWQERYRALTSSSLPFFTKCFYKIAFSLFLLVKKISPNFKSISNK